VQHLHHCDARAQGAAAHYVNQMNAAASNSALTTMDEPTEARKRISCLLIADAAVNCLSKPDERPPNADAKSGEPQDGKHEKDVGFFQCGHSGSGPPGTGAVAISYKDVCATVLLLHANNL
jgi:hypothetical protein